MTELPLLQLRGVSRNYRKTSFLGRSRGKAVLKKVSLDLSAGERVALVGRSGCGKSTLSRLLLGFEKPDQGQVLFEGQPVSQLAGAAWKDFRRAVQIVFQDSIGATNPRQRLGDAVAEPLRHLTDLDAPARSARVLTLLAQVGLEPSVAAKLPSQVSGGQLQRVAIARSLAPDPRLIVLDEAVSSLDLPLQLQTLEMIRNIGTATGAGYLLITHDLRLARRYCDRIVLMDDGALVEDRIVERGMRFAHPAGHALELALLPAMPRPSFAAA